MHKTKLPPSQDASALHANTEGAHIETLTEHKQTIDKCISALRYLSRIDGEHAERVDEIQLAGLFRSLEWIEGDLSTVFDSFGESQNTARIPSFDVPEMLHCICAISPFNAPDNDSSNKADALLSAEELNGVKCLIQIAARNLSILSSVLTFQIEATSRLTTRGD